MQQETKVIVEPIKTAIMKVTVKAIEGSTLISHRLGSEQMLKVMRKETGKAKTKEFRDFEAEYESCFYRTGDDKYGIPVSAFMSSMLDAATTIDGISKTNLKRGVRLLGDVLELRYDKINHRIDFPRRSGKNGTPDERHRPEFFNWECDLIVQYDTNIISPEQIINLINRSGFNSGVGDWRPSSPRSSGVHGMFTVKEAKH